MKKIIGAMFLSVFLFIAACSSSSQYPQERVDALANCLADNGVKEYGAFWCPNCEEQKKMFGKSYEILMDRDVYIECDPRGEKEQAEFCLEKKVEKYPTWEFPSGEVVIGVTSFEDLAQKSGCSW
jgi:hypothetical protein